jgi:G3E family GTPase
VAAPQASFPDPLTDDVQAVRKRVDSGELLVFETTGIALPSQPAAQPCESRWNQG